MTAIAIATLVYMSKISIESSIVGTEVELLRKPRIVVKLSGSLGKAYWIGSELAGDVGR